MKRFIIAALFFILFLNSSFGQGQVTVSSTSGYTVKINIISLVLNKTPYPNNPTGGCNYTVTLNYNISFSGTNIPNTLYTLQGNVRCNQSTFFDLPNNGGIGTVTSANASYNGNPATLTLASICKKIDIEIHGPGITSKIVTIPIGGALPIELLAFDAKSNGQQVDLNWSTASERDNDFFTIEKTVDGINYETVAIVEASGNSSTQKDYSYTDYNPSAGTSYYRLKQTDFNGDSESFEPMAVEIAKTTVISNVFPNPATESRINLTVSAIETAVTVNLYTMYGQLVSTLVVDAANGNSTQVLELPEHGNAFIVELIQDNSLIARHKVLANH